MKTNPRFPNFIFALVLFAGLLACKLVTQEGAEAPVQPPAPARPTARSANPAIPAITVTPATAPAAELSLMRQWATGAKASSEYGSSSWAAYQAGGAPDTRTCGDHETAWAAANSSSVEWIELSYATPVEPQQVNVHISYNPIHIIKMELLDTKGAYHQIYGFEPRSYPECPTVFSIDVSERGYQAVGVKITIDQRTAADWVEIDAVELVGMGLAGVPASAAQPSPATSLPPSPTPGASASTPITALPTAEAAVFETPPGFLWRMGGTKAFDEHARFAGLWGLDYDPLNEMIFAADAVYHIQVIGASGGQTPQGEHIGQFKHADMRVPQDVKVDASGKVYVAAWSSGKVLVFGPTGGGEPVLVFGEHGRESDQFGEYSPGALAVGLDGRIYVHDTNKNERGEAYDRIMIFSPQGEWLQNFSFSELLFSLGGMDVGPDGNLYLAGFVGSRVLKFSPDGDLLDELGEQAIRSVGSGPKGLALDQQGNLYLALWSGEMVKLDPQGNLLGQWGVPVKDGENDWPPGGFYQPGGIAVSPDGSQVFVTDTSSQYAYLTAFTFNAAAVGEGSYAEWASGAEATSDDYQRGLSAQMAAGAPDASTCGSPGAGWAPANSGGLESLTVYYYDPPLIPSRVNIVLSQHASQIVKVELLAADGEHADVLIYEAAPQEIAACPYTLSIPVNGIDYPIIAIRITVDPSAGAQVSEIDAVQLVGSAP